MHRRAHSLPLKQKGVTPTLQIFSKEAEPTHNVFGGEFGILDHALASASLVGQSG